MCELAISCPANYEQIMGYGADCFEREISEYAGDE